MRFAVATEDAVSEAVAETLLMKSNRSILVVQRLRRQGFGYLKKNIRNFAQVAEHVMPVLVLTDLDQKLCAPTMVHTWLPAHAGSRLYFRVAVRETESWLLADRDGLAGFLGISQHSVPARPEELDDPKTSLLSLVRKSRKRDLKEDLLPRKGVSSPVGLGYNERLSGFVRRDWDCHRAAQHSPSLARALARIREFPFGVPNA